MVFSSLIFLFIFLPITLTLYFLLGNRFRNTILLICSLFFYFWGEAHYVFVMVASIAINYVFGLAIDRKNSTTAKKIILCFAVSSNLALLGFYKYFGFILEILTPVFQVANLPIPSSSTPHLPIGISFFTFQSLSYVIDVYRRQVTAQANPFTLGLYISLFPQLIAGPIVRYQDVALQLSKRSHSIQNLSMGIERFIIGLSKKVLIANVLADIADSIFEIPISSLSTQDAWLGIACYTLQIYFDFSGYSDMAIGLGKMFGFDFLENFNYPYISQSMQEFWRRWHISLSTWFRDYLYIPLGGNKKGSMRTYLNLFLVFALCGLWHGANMTFLVWGLYHGFFLILERWKFSKILHSLPRPLRHIYTIFVITAGWVIFRSPSLEGGIDYLMRMFMIGPTPPIPTHTWLLAKTNFLVWCTLVFGVVGATPLFPYARTFTIFVQKLTVTCFFKRNLSLFSYGSRFLFLSTPLYMSIFSLASGTYNPFIYFRF